MANSRHNGLARRLPLVSEEVMSLLKEKVGRATNNPDLEAEGQVEKIAGKVQKKIGEVKKVLGT